MQQPVCPSPQSILWFPKSVLPFSVYSIWLNAAFFRASSFFLPSLCRQEKCLFACLVLFCSILSLNQWRKADIWKPPSIFNEFRFSINLDIKFNSPKSWYNRKRSHSGQLYLLQMAVLSLCPEYDTLLNILADNKRRVNAIFSFFHSREFNT